MRTILISLVLLVCLGCLPESGTTRNTEVDDGLRAACPLMTDFEIRSLLSSARAGEETGFGYFDQLEAVFYVCGYDNICVSCGTAVLDHYYGYR